MQVKTNEKPCRTSRVSLIELDLYSSRLTGFVLTTLNDDAQDFLAMLYGDFDLQKDTNARNELRANPLTICGR